MNKKLIAIVVLILSACNFSTSKKERKEESGNSFLEDVQFLRKHTNILVLEDSTGNGKVAVSPALQGRVMTSSAEGDNGNSFGWIHNALFESGDTSQHFNAFGGEERLWIGPEGGQFSIFFEKGKEFTLDNWYTPKFIDLEPFELVSSSKSDAGFTKSADLKNYSGTQFKIKIDRKVNVLDNGTACKDLGIEREPLLKMVAFRTTNSIQNIGPAPWSKTTGLLSIWLLGMLKPNPFTTIVIPFNNGSDDMGPVVNDMYFGKVPPNRLKVGDGVIFFKGDGKYRSKIGLSPMRAKDVMGSYDSKSQTLTIVKYNKPVTSDYVNSAWEIQDQPFKGDVINSYNDGPPSPGAKPMGPFYELESSSPAMELNIGENVVHIQTTFHFQGDEEALDKISMKIFGVPLNQIKNAFPPEIKNEKQ